LDEILESLLDDFNITQVLSIIHKELNNKEISKELLIIIFYMDEQILKLNLINKIKKMTNIEETVIPENITKL
jgi:hypothetical protein